MSKPVRAGYYVLCGSPLIVLLFSWLNSEARLLLAASLWTDADEDAGLQEESKGFRFSLCVRPKLRLQCTATVDLEKNFP